MTGLGKLYQDIATALNAVYGNYSFSLSKALDDPGDLDDVTFSGVYSGNKSIDQVIIKIDSVGATDTFSFQYGANVQAAIPIVANQEFDLVDGIHVKFGAKTGHTLDDSWTFNVAGKKVFKTVRLFNNQINSEREGKSYDFEKPGAFVQFDATEDIQQLGGNAQLYNELMVWIHVVHEWYDDQQGNFEQDLHIFDLKQYVYYALNKLMPDGAGAFVRVAERIDSDHDNLVTYSIGFRTNYEDVSLNDPIKYIIKYPDTAFQADRDTNIQISDPYTR